jgi:hypothetical protein
VAPGAADPIASDRLASSHSREREAQQLGAPGRGAVVHADAGRREPGAQVVRAIGCLQAFAALARAVLAIGQVALRLREPVRVCTQRLPGSRRAIGTRTARGRAQSGQRQGKESRKPRANQHYS